MPFTEEERTLLLDNAYRDPRLPELLERMEREGPGRLPVAPGFHEEEQLPLWERVWNLIYHQGTLYPATFIAVPAMCRSLRLEEDNTYPLSSLAEIEAMRCASPNSKAGFPALPDAVWSNYAEAIRSLTPFVLRGLEMSSRHAREEEGLDAAMLSLLAFAAGKTRLGFALARWWPYALVGDRQVLLASVQQYEDWKGSTLQSSGESSAEFGTGE